MTRWEQVPGRSSAQAYQARFDQLAAAGHGVHGEADLCARLAAPGARVLDAGCGTGRVGAELARRGFPVIGVDVDPAMLAQAARLSPDVSWRELDLANLDLHALGDPEPFDLVVAAGNVIPLVAAGTEAQVVARLSGVLRPGGLLVAGFGLDARHLPLPEPPFGLDAYDQWCQTAGLQLTARYASWDAAGYDGGGYAVSVHTRGELDK